MNLKLKITKEYQRINDFNPRTDILNDKEGDLVCRIPPCFGYVPEPFVSAI
jgi:hypothetical protein